MRKTPWLPFLLVALFIVLVEWRAHLFALWNCVPVAIGYLLLRRARRSGFHLAPELAFIVSSAGLLLLVHIAWIFDWSEVATGSSTAGLIFLFLPIYALIFGGICFGVVRLFTVREVQ